MTNPIARAPRPLPDLPMRSRIFGIRGAACADEPRKHCNREIL